jgi:hypothetical protein
VKHATLYFALSILFMQAVKSQDSLKSVNSHDTVKYQHIYSAYVFRPGHRSPDKGFLVTIQDSSLYMSQAKSPISFGNVNLTSLEKFDYRYIQKVVVRKPGVVGRSILIGVIVGVAAGALIGYSLGSDHGFLALDAGGKAVVGGIIGAGAGTLVGGIIGNASQKKFMINGEWKSLQEMKESLQNK